MQPKQIAFICGWLFLPAMFFPSATALAEELNIMNHSFESPVAIFTGGVPMDWTAISPDPPAMWTENTDSTGMVNSDLNQHAGMNSSDGYIYQDLGVPFRPNTTYRAEVATAHRSGHVHGILQFGLFSSSNIGTDLGTAGFSDMQSVWVGSGNPDADNSLGLFRDTEELDAIGTGSLAEPYSYTTNGTPPKGNVVVFLRITNTAANPNRRVHFDNVRVTVDSDEILLGDINCDGFVNLLDVSPFIDLLASGGFQQQADINGDGSVDLLDVAPFIELLQ